MNSIPARNQVLHESDGPPPAVKAGGAALPENPSILLTIDVEDWFQVENFKSCIPHAAWSSCELRVERNTLRLLDLLDSMHVAPLRPVASEGPGEPCGHTVLQAPKATFFVLAWIAERLPRLVREISARGHEIGSHGCSHELCSAQSPGRLWDDLIRSKRTLEDISGSQVAGFRAPSFSITEHVLEKVRDAGYQYDSSYNSFSLHDRYGRLDLTRADRDSTLTQPVDGLYELPVSNMQVGKRTAVPWGGGAYFRLIPKRLFRSGIRFILKSRGVYVMYLHPWEIDPDQPRVEWASPSRRFRHYSNLGKTWSRMAGLIHAFSHCAFISCTDYIDARTGRVP
jgi:polysaccharide deacetylase family protein (PEP-CTERM system associated)